MTPEEIEAIARAMVDDEQNYVIDQGDAYEVCKAYLALLEQVRQSATQNDKNGQDKMPDQGRKIAPPSIEPNGVYSTKEILSNLKISRETLDHWLANGLKRPSREKLRTKEQFYLGDQILDFIRSNLE